MKQTRFPNLLTSNKDCINWNDIIIYIGVFKLTLTTETMYMLIFLNVKTSEIIHKQGFNVKINPSIIIAFMISLLTSKFPSTNLSTLIIHTQVGYHFNSKVFKAMLKLTILQV